MTIQELIERCKCGVHLTVNEHRDYYQTTSAWLAERAESHAAGKIDDDIPPDARARILEADSLVVLQFYPDTPVSFYLIVDSTLEGALAQAEKAFTQ